MCLRGFLVLSQVVMARSVVSDVVGTSRVRNTHYTVQIPQSEPCIMEDKNKARAVPHRYTGFCDDVLQKLSHDLGFTYTIEIVNPPDQEWLETYERAVRGCARARARRTRTGGHLGDQRFGVCTFGRLRVWAAGGGRSGIRTGAAISMRLVHGALCV